MCVWGTRDEKPEGLLESLSGEKAMFRDLELETACCTDLELKTSCCTDNSINFNYWHYPLKKAEDVTKKYAESTSQYFSCEVLWMLEIKIPFSRSVQKALLERQVRGMLKDWCFSRTRINMLINEYKDMKANYLPVDVHGLTVLDVGAGEGETALFYLAYGAKKVICVEANPECFNNLVLNSKKHSIVPVLKPFNVEMLNEFDFDFMKCDIEGYEEVLLDMDLVKPAVIEVHGLQLRDKFAEKGYRIGKRILENGNYWACSTSYAFWKC